MVSKPGGNQFNNRGHIMEVSYGTSDADHQRQKKERGEAVAQDDKHHPSLEGEKDTFKNVTL